MLKQKTIAFIGGGFMAEALINGLIASENAAPGNITVTDIRGERLQYLQNEYGVKTEERNREAASAADILVLAVKPQNMRDVLADIRDCIGENVLVITIAAGVKLKTIENYFTGKIVRVMPNSCAQVREAVTAITFNGKVEKDDRELAVSFFSSVGQTVIVDESMMDAVTAISGSGPAYVFLLAESLIKAGIDSGLSAANARMLVLQTIKGASELALSTGEEPAVLRKRVTSPGGTTAAALETLDGQNVRGAFADAVSAAIKRSKELG